MDLQKIPALLDAARSPGQLREAQATAAQALAAQGLPAFPTNACALTLSALLRMAHIDVPLTFGAGHLAMRLGGPERTRHWQMVRLGQQQAGDVGVCFDNTPPSGADHIYLVVEPRSDGDEMLIADNQADSLHIRYASGRGHKTPTDYFLRATEDGDARAINAVAFGAAFAGHAESSASVLSSIQDDIALIAIASPVARYDWADRGTAPAGFVKGMAIAYAMTRSELQAGGEVAKRISRLPVGDADIDALAWLATKLEHAGIAPASSEQEMLRLVFVVLLGLGMQESSGRYCEGRDRNANNTTAETAEAGPFQCSYNARHGDVLMPRLFESSKGHRDLLAVFSEGVRCHAADLETFGEGEGAIFQQLSKSNPLFAVHFAALGLRSQRRHWGPINTRAVDVLPQALSLFKGIDAYADDLGASRVLNFRPT